MSDLAITWNNERGVGDLVLAGGTLSMDAELASACVISLLCERRARDDDELPAAGADRRGWWGDVAPTRPGAVTGSRLWLLAREKQLPSVLARARLYAQEALSWLVEDKIARSLAVEASFPTAGALGVEVTLTRPDGRVYRQRFDYLWEQL